MTGTDRLRALAGAWEEWGLGETLAEMADEIDRELREGHDPAADVSMSAYDLLSKEERNAIAWVREHGGLDHVMAEWDRRSNLKRTCEKLRAKVERQQSHIELVQGKYKTRVHRIVELHKTIDEMRPRLMPEGMEWLLEAWPRFEDDAPLRIGDEGLDAYGRAHRAERVTLSEGGHVDVCDESGDVWWSNTRRDEHDDVMLDLGKRIKRPAPKVLDADGVEIRVGDTVCGTQDMEPMRVVDADYRECGFKRIKCEKEGVGFFFYWADELTHNLPVLAADGKPLEVGQTVWDTDAETDTPLTVVEVSSDLVRCEYTWKDGKTYRPCYRPSDLTHTKPEPPDSYCRLYADMAGRNGNARTPNGIDFGKFLRRCKALADRERGE